jgi:PAS domain S-box-containing protein
LSSSRIRRRRHTSTTRSSCKVPRVPQDLEEELVRVRSQLGATIEQYETQVEEAKASNEELQATNEELRSSAEELETSREELQSVNEELTTVNQELKIKVEELRLTNNDFQNFINATSIPTVFLDRALQVKFSNTRAQEIFNLLPTDVGRPLSDITSRITYDRLLADATQVLDHLHTIEREVRTHEGRLHLMRILPYRTLEDRIEGVVITFVDVTTLRQAEADTFASDQRLRLLIETAPDYAIFTMDDEGHIDSWNIGAQRMWGYKAEHIVGKHFAECSRLRIVRPAYRPPCWTVFAAAVATSRNAITCREDGTTFYASGVTTRLGSDGTLGFAKIAHDLTATREAEAALSHAQDSLEERVDQRTSELAHEQEQVSAGCSARWSRHRKTNGAGIARDLHDQLGQQLTALRLTLERGQQNRMVGRDLDDELERGLAIVSAVTEEVDFLAWELRPAVLDDLGLAAALPRFLREWSKHYTVDAEFRLSGFAAGHLSKEVEVTYYRVAQEALSNVMKHAHASRVDVVLETRDGVVTLCIGDDGIGFEMPGDQDRFGLVGMKNAPSSLAQRSRWSRRQDTVRPCICDRHSREPRRSGRHRWSPRDAHPRLDRRRS